MRSGYFLDHQHPNSDHRYSVFERQTKIVYGRSFRVLLKKILIHFRTPRQYYSNRTILSSWEMEGSFTRIVNGAVITLSSLRIVLLIIAKPKV